MKKVLGIITVNIILFFIILLSIELIIWGCENLRIKIQKETHSGRLPFPFHPGIQRINLVDISHFKNPDITYVRQPEGIEYKNKPLVIFGCSYAYGFNLNNEQTFSYKLSHLTKRPVYNRAAAGWGIQYMLNQVRQSEFYNDIPEPEYVIYVMINDHFRRLYVPTFLSASFINEKYNLRYEYKNGGLVQEFEANKLLEFIHRLYFVQKIEHFYINNILLRKENHEKYFSFALEHFIESRNEMQKHWKNTQYVIILYQTFRYDYIFAQKLKKNGFIVISLPIDYNLNLRTPKFEQSDFHPKEEAWDLVTPKVIESINL